MAWTALIGPILGVINNVVDRAVPDRDKAAELKAQITNELLLNERELATAARDVIVAEAQGQSWLQRNWRPLLMIVIIAIVANNYLIAPYMAIFFPDKVKILELPSELYSLMTVGVGGYILGRSGEKIAANLRRE